MPDNPFWTLPMDHMTTGSGTRYELTVLQPPFTVSTAELPPNDPAQAAAFARSLDTIDDVLEDLGTCKQRDTHTVNTRADLDVVQVGVWGNLMSISEPAFADDGNDMPLLAEATRLRKRFPDARIVGRVEVHCGAEHTEDLVWLPDGTMFHACGWPGDEPFVVAGDPQAVMTALGITAELLDELEVYFDLDDEPDQNDWGALATVCLGDADPWGRSDLDASILRVRHSESATSHMESLYFITG
ncbi:DUF6333 family protein [Streptomyces sp. P9-2B-2]|uniref:DUF6333 family protein n=1 Tax=Streptomyces TaxID=1883 RepID=UPI00225ABE03|nr:MULTISPECIES: DUF6333 family protein [Streptomyces]MCX4635093.1 DUF6333 family protein [Streptomyces platensis]WJY41516.1 DUF6333 family protein [Streptomyces sp. P9-2B-2]